MKRSALVAVPALCVLLLASGGAASAVTGVPVVKDPLVKVVGTAPTAIVPDTNGSFFVLNSGPSSVIKYDAAGQQIGPLAALLPDMSASTAMLSDAYGSLFVANPGTHSVSQINTGSSGVNTFSLPAADVPVALAISSNRNVYVTKTDDEVARITSAGVVTNTFAKLPAGSDPRGVAVDSAGNVYTANHGNGTISQISVTGTVVQYAALPMGSGPIALARASNNMLYVANQSAGTIVKFDMSKPAGTAPVATYTLPPGAGPRALVADEFDNIFVAEAGMAAISVIVPGSANPQRVSIRTSYSPGTLAITSDNKLLFAQLGTDSVSSIDLETKIGTSTIGPLTVGSAFAGTATATGVGDITFSSPDLPAWLKLDPATGALSGTPTTAGPFSFTLRASSSIGRSDARTVSFDVAVAPSTPTPTPTATPGTTTPPTGGTGGSGGGAGVGGGAGTGAGTGVHGTSSLASTGASEMVPWGAFGAVATFLGAVALIATTRRRARRSA